MTKQCKAHKNSIMEYCIKTLIIDHHLESPQLKHTSCHRGLAATMLINTQNIIPKIPFPGKCKPLQGAC